MIKINPIHAFKDNYIWIIHNEKYAVIIDPGIATPVIEYIRQYHLKLIAILITHHHHDHTGGNLELSQLFRVQIYGPLKETIPGMTDGLEEGNIISLPELSLNLTVLDIPGHTAGHIAYYDSNHLFCGDTLFSCGCGRIFEGTAQQMYHSLKKITALPDQTQVYCTHEYTLSNIHFATEIDPTNSLLTEYANKVRMLRANNKPTIPTTLAIEKSINPFLRCEHPAIINAANQHAETQLSDAISVFSEIRKWKDHYQPNVH